MFSLFQKLFYKKRNKEYALNKFICLHIDKAIKLNIDNERIYSAYEYVNENSLLCFLLKNKCFIVRHKTCCSAYDYIKGGIRLKHLNKILRKSTKKLFVSMTNFLYFCKVNDMKIDIDTNEVFYTFPINIQ